jgi:NitT/TauT family transport system substrate-binding protein
MGTVGKRLGLVALLAALAWWITTPSTAAPAPLVPVKFTTDWVWQGVYAPYVVAAEKGFFAQEGLAVEVDRGTGSADAAVKIAAGAYDFGVVDLAVLVEFNARNPGKELRAIGVIYNYSPLSIMSLRNYGIATPRDLEGRKIGAPAGAAARVLFPAFARVAGIDKDRVEWVTVSGALREPMLLRREVDATAPFIDALLTLKGLGVPPEHVVVFHYPRYGLDLYGLGVVARPETLGRRPEVARGVMRAIVRAWQYSMRHPDEMIELLAGRDPLIRKDVEKERFLLAVERLVATPEVGAYGIGYASRERLYRHIEVVTETLGLPRRIAIDDLYTGRFLPPREHRLLPR